MKNISCHKPTISNKSRDQNITPSYYADIESYAPIDPEFVYTCILSLLELTSWRFYIYLYL